MFPVAALWFPSSDTDQINVGVHSCCPIKVPAVFNGGQTGVCTPASTAER